MRKIVISTAKICFLGCVTRGNHAAKERPFCGTLHVHTCLSSPRRHRPYLKNTKMHYFLERGQSEREGSKFLSSSVVCTQHANFVSKWETRRFNFNSSSQGAILQQKPRRIFAQSALQRSLNFNVNLTSFIDFFLLFSAFERH